jgi:hypothetical protein
MESYVKSIQIISVAQHFTQVSQNSSRASRSSALTEGPKQHKKQIVLSTL